MSGFAGLLTVLCIKEIVQIILKDLSLDDIFQLSACCTFLREKWCNGRMFECVDLGNAKRVFRCIAQS